MVLNPGYELRIPRDSVVVLQRDGLLGGTIVTIDPTTASGPPIEDGGNLQSRTAEDLSPAKALELLERLKRLEESCSTVPEKTKKHEE
jgi:ABC-type transporter Mla subunit MlaD